MARTCGLILLCVALLVAVGCKAAIRQGPGGTEVEIDTRPTAPLIPEPAPTSAPSQPTTGSVAANPAGPAGALTPDQQAMNALWKHAGQAVRNGDWGAFREDAKLMARLAGKIIRARSTAGATFSDAPVLTDLDSAEIRSVIGHAAGAFDELDTLTDE